MTTSFGTDYSRLDRRGWSLTINIAFGKDRTIPGPRSLAKLVMCARSATPLNPSLHGALPIPPSVPFRARPLHEKALQVGWVYCTPMAPSGPPKCTLSQFSLLGVLQLPFNRVECTNICLILKIFITISSYLIARETHSVLAFALDFVRLLYIIGSNHFIPSKCIEM